MDQSRAAAAVNDGAAAAGSGPTRLVCVGAIAGAHGIQGHVRIHTFTAEPAGIAAYGPVSDADGAREWHVRLVAQSGERVIAALSGVRDRNAAEGLKGVRLYVPRDALPAAEEDEYYHADLVGLTVLGQEGEGTPPRMVGTVAAVHDFGAGPLLEVARDGGGTLLLPFTRDAVPEVDLKAGCLKVALLPGLFEPAAPSRNPRADQGEDGR